MFFQDRLRTKPLPLEALSAFAGGSGQSGTYSATLANDPTLENGLDRGTVACRGPGGPIKNSTLFAISVGRRISMGSYEDFPKILIPSCILLDDEELALRTLSLVIHVLHVVFVHRLSGRKSRRVKSWGPGPETRRTFENNINNFFQGRFF